MDQKQLTYFIAVAKYRNFSRLPGFLSDPACHQPSDQNVGKGIGYRTFVRNTKKSLDRQRGNYFSKMQNPFSMQWNRQNKNWIWQKNSLPYCVSAIFLLPTHQFLPEVCKSVSHPLSS